MENIQIGLLLLLVGMVTVFAILTTIIYLGKALIGLVNKYAPEETAAVRKAPAAGPAPIPSHIIAAITAAVNVVTHNKGKVVKVERKN